MKRILITLLILIITVAVGGGYFIYLKVLIPGDVPAKVMNAEEVIATTGTIAIASVDMAYIRQIDKALSSVEDPSPLPVTQSKKSTTETSFLEKLKKQGVDLISQTDYAIATINVLQKKPAFTFVLFGHFSKDKLKLALKQSYLVDEGANSYWIMTQHAEQEKTKDPCAAPINKVAPKQYALQVKNDRIILSSPKLMPILLRRFASNVRASISLEKWRKFRKDKAAAVAVMSPKKVKKGATDLPSALLLGAISSQPLNEIYGGVEVSLLPSPGFKFLVNAHSNKAEWPLEVKSKYDAWLDETVNDLKGMPTAVSLFQSLNVQADGNVLRFSTIADKTTLENLEKIPGEFLKMAFSGAFGSGEVVGGESVEKIIKDSEIKRYASRFNFSSVPSFDETNVFYKSDFLTGPFGVRLKRIGLLATDDSVIELKVNVEGKGFENLSGELIHRSDDSPTTNLLITSVEDKDGNNLLREELCGKNRNILAAALTTTRDKEYVDNEWISKSIKVYGDKNVRLKQLVLLSQVAIIKGKVVVRAATQTSVNVLKHPFAKKTIKTSKVRMYLKKSNSSTVKYDISGDASRILAIRAKNAKGQYLASEGSSALSYEGIKTISKRFSGKIASIEVVVAEQMKSEEYPFEIKQVSPRYGKIDGGKQVDVKYISKKRFLRKYAKVNYKDQCKDKQKVRAGAFLVCLNKFGKLGEQSIGGEFDVIGPDEEALQNDISAAVLSIDSVVTGSGKKISFNAKAPVAFKKKFDAQYNEKKKKWQIINRRLHASEIKIFSNIEKFKDETIMLVNGTLTLRIPKKSKHIVLDATALGIAKKSKDGITASISAFENWSTYIDFQGSVNKIMRLMPLSKHGTILNTGNDRINEKTYLTLEMSKDEQEKIKKLPKKWQGMITIYGQPEKIRIFYANSFDIIKYKFQFKINE